MDVTKILSELRKEREYIEQAILALEQVGRRPARTAGAGAQAATGIRRVGETDGFPHNLTATESRRFGGPGRGAVEDD